MLSKKTKYGIKALTFLGRQENRTPVAIATISKSENISLKFLIPIFISTRTLSRFHIRNYTSFSLLIY